MLAASGVKTNATIVPIIIDPDFANADLTRTVESLCTYSQVRSNLNFNTQRSNTFFSTDFIALFDKYTFTIQKTKDCNFSDFIGRSTMSDENKALSEILFSEHNLNSGMDVGFKGNPNVGSVVLNQFVESPQFNQFANDFQQGDRIFIISSIFGGTGASGFPLLLNNLRNIQPQMPNCNIIKNAIIGAITVLPYFNVLTNPNSEVDSATFIGKTKAALGYYADSICDPQSALINALYYIGDTNRKSYSNQEGGITQKNNAHFIELASALAVVDFINTPNNSLGNCQVNQNTNCVTVQNPCYKEFGIAGNGETGQLVFNDLDQKTNAIIEKPMTQFVLFSKYFKDKIKSSLRQPWMKDKKIDETYLQSPFIKDLRSFQDSYLEWLKEMENNTVGFKPYNLDVNQSNLFHIVEGLKPKTLMKLASGYDLFDSYLNEGNKNLHSSGLKKEEIIFELFCKVTSILCEKKLNIL
jgi:hypothetical protein